MAKKGLRCVSCGRMAAPAKFRFQGHALGGWKCRCGEEYFDSGQAQRILALNKLMMEAVSAKLGRIRSNLILRVPKLVEQALGLSAGKFVRLTVKNRHSVELSV